MIIPLICTQCNGTLEASKDRLFVADDCVIVLDGGLIECPYCGTQFLPGQEVKRGFESAFNQTGQIVGKQININGGVVGAIGDGLHVGPISFQNK